MMNSITDDTDPISCEQKDTGRKKGWERPCPDCGDPQFFPHKSRYLAAIASNRRCRSCAKINYYENIHEKDLRREFINGKCKYFRRCPKCGEKIFYNSAGRRNHMEKRGEQCRKCFFKNRTKWNGPIVRECPACGNQWHITTLNGYKHSLRKNTVCSSCRNLLYPKITPDVIRKIRLTAINNVQMKQLAGVQLIPGFNAKACLFFDNLNKTNSWNLIHALNGGEVYLKSLGYWLDSYDAIRNIVVEWYEKHHFRKGILRIKDIRRKEEIKNLLKCRFIGYDWNSNKIIDES